jgi:adenylate kinase family enzyme
MKIGPKVAVVGMTAVGKSIFGRALANKSGLPLVLIDSIMWKPGWNYLGDEETAQKLDEASREEKWIIEGYLVDAARPFVLGRADTIIYLDYHPLVASWRYIKRWWKHRTDPRLELPGSPERFSFKFLELSWTKGEITYLDELLGKPEYRNKIIRLKSPTEAEKFLRELQH